MISPEVMQELLSVRQVLHYLPASASTEKGWTEHEQHLFWVALAQHPQGPWTTIAEFIGTKSTRQTMTHGQKLRQKLKRWNERLRLNPTASMLMDGVTLSTSSDFTVRADIAVGTMAPITIDASMTSSECCDLQTVPSYATSGQSGDLETALTMDGMSIVSDDTNTFELTNTAMTLTSSSSTPMVEAGLPSVYPDNHMSHPNLSTDTARVVELMMSESSEEVTVTDFSDDPEILPQDLLDDLLEILSDEDLNELNHHHSNPSTC